MATRFTATWTATDKELWESGDIVTEATFRDHVGQNIEHLGTVHNHDGSDGNGGAIPTADPKSIFFYGVTGGGPFA